MTSKIINMADKIQDAEDRILESLFQSDVIADDGFSDQVLKRMRRQLWVRRLALPIAMLVGAAVAVRPALELVAVGSRLFGSLADAAVVPGTAVITQVPYLLVGGLILALVMTTFRLFEE